MDDDLHYYKPQVKKIEHVNKKKVKCKLFILVSFSFYCFYFKMLLSDWECELYWFVNKVIMFQKALQFIKTIAFCYNK